MSPICFCLKHEKHRPEVIAGHLHQCSTVCICAQQPTPAQFQVDRLFPSLVSYLYRSCGHSIRLCLRIILNKFAHAIWAFVKRFTKGLYCSVISNRTSILVPPELRKHPGLLSFSIQRRSRKRGSSRWRRLLMSVAGSSNLQRRQVHQLESQGYKQPHVADYSERGVSREWFLQNAEESG